MAIWTELRLVIPRERVEDAVGLMLELGAEGVQEDHLPGEAPPLRQPWDTGPLPAPSARLLLRGWWQGDGAEACAELRARVTEWEKVDPPTAHPVDESDWAESWKAGLNRIVVGDLAVAPPWLAQPGDLVIEPGMAFGTGEHPTTRRCLEAVERLARPGARCLDIGCGTGVLALAAARRGMIAHGMDIDPEAIRASIENAERNGIEASFDTRPLSEVKGQWDLVVANLYAEVLVALAPDIVRLTGGVLVLAGILEDRAPKVEAALQPLRVVGRQQDGEWICLELRR